MLEKAAAYFRSSREDSFLGANARMFENLENQKRREVRKACEWLAEKLDERVAILESRMEKYLTNAGELD